MSASTMHAAEDPGNEIASAAHEAGPPHPNDRTSPYRRPNECLGIRGSEYMPSRLPGRSLAHAEDLHSSCSHKYFLRKPI
ncbi:MAG TPA: hypothetical protein VEI57_17305, partial [Nitrospirota bacterium]|nr:hypothetical protein [Nitrospirota bacterium]